MPFRDYLRLLRSNGRFVQVGVPEDALPPMYAFDIIVKGLSVTGSIIGSPEDIRYMLQLAADKGIKPWVEERSMKDANQVVLDMDAGKARYRYTLVNEAQA